MHSPDFRAASHEAACIADPRGRVTWVGPGWARVAGRDLVVGARLAALADGDDDATVDAVLARLAREGGETGLAVRVGGRPTRWTLAAGPGGDVHVVVLAHPDVARLEADLRRTRHLLDAFVGHATDAFYIKDLDGRYVFANPAAERMVNRAPGSLVGVTDEEVFSAESYAEIRAIDARVVRTGLPHTNRPVRYDFGDARVLLSTKAPYHDEDGLLAGILGTSRDVTDVFLAEQAARAADASFRDLVDGTPDVVLVHADGQVAFANDAAARALGCACAEELLGLELRELVWPEDRDLAAAWLAARAGTTETFALARRDGSALPVEAIDVRVAWMGRSAGVIVARDLTDRRRMEARLAQADRLATAGTLAAGVAHEVNNPLTFVLHHLRRLEEQIPLLAPGSARAADLARLAAEAADGGERIAAIVRGLKAFARGDEGEVGPTDVDLALDQAIRMATVKLRGRATLVRHGADVPLVRGVEARLVQVLLNLLVNAAQAVPAGDATRHRVTVDVLPLGEGVAIDVSDTGPGIAPEIRGRLFEPFVTTRGPAEGTGLGLWVCHAIVTAWGGRIEAGDAPGGGARFRVWLPAAGDRVAEEDPPAPLDVGDDALARGRLLVVEDEPLIGELLQLALEDLGEVVRAANGAEALAALADPRFDVILCDLMLPDTTGVELYGAFRDAGLADRVLFMTGGAPSPEVRQFLEDVVNPCIDKPFSVTTVREQVRARLVAT